MAETEKSSGWSLSDPSKWVPLVLLLGGLVGVYVSQVVSTNKNAQDIQSNQISDVQGMQNILGVISDMKAQLIPKRVQTLEDSFASPQASNASQFQALQQAIASIQTSNSNAQQAMQSTLHEIVSQLNTQGTSVALMNQQINEMLSGPTLGKRK
jgi:hypothetical protein